MLFNTYGFVAFFAVVYAGYWVLRGHGVARNTLLLAASYFFYGSWDWRFLFLLAVSTLIDFAVGIGLERYESPAVRKRLLLTSLASNLGMLGVFKYFDFFAASVTEAAAGLGFEIHPVMLRVTLPVGISFYTFQTLSYSIDVYRRRISATRSLLDFALYVAFFPQLVAGPIERASNLLPQIADRLRPVRSSQVEEGICLILLGYTKKMVIADRAGLLADRIFNNHTAHQGLDLWAGALAFTFQIYGDFSGYSDIARGISKLMGFEMMVNFKLPYFSRTPAEFWRRWHISLSEWLRDYLYIPLGGNRGAEVRTARNLMITMLLGGLWHGASWNFVTWGAYHGALLGIYRVSGLERRPASSRGGALVRWGVMFVLTVFGWVIFRAESIGQTGYFLTRMLQPGFSTSVLAEFIRNALFWLPLLALEWQENRTGDLTWLLRLRVWQRGMVYGVLAVVIMALGERVQAEFIYFQF